MLKALFSSPFLLRRTVRALERLGDLQQEANGLARQQLKLAAIRANVRLSQLDTIGEEEEAEAQAAPGKPAMEALAQTEGDLALRERMEALMADFFHSQGKEPPLDFDPLEWAKREGYLERGREEFDPDFPLPIRVFGRRSR